MTRERALIDSMTNEEKEKKYQEVYKSILSLVEGEKDEVAMMATIACELHHHFEHFHWTGFYRVVAEKLLKVGPYQGGHGCLVIPFDKGVCGKAAREEHTQVVEDVNAITDHIACSSTTQSEIVVPVYNKSKNLIAVLDVDSDEPAAFDEIDQRWLEKIVEVFEIKS